MRVGPVGAGPPLVGLVVDDHETRPACARAGRCSPRAPASPSVGDDEQLAPVLGAAGRGGDDRCAERRAAQVGDRCLEPDDALGGALGARPARRCRAPVTQVGVLEHGVHGAADRGAVAAALPRRQVEVDAVLVQPGVAVERSPAGPAWRRPPRGFVVAGAPARPPARWRSSPTARARRPSPARARRPRRQVGPRQLERLGRHAARRPPPASSSAAAPCSVAPHAASRSTLGRPAEADWSASRGSRCSDTTRWSTARVQATYSRRRRSASPICSSIGLKSSNSVVALARRASTCPACHTTDVPLRRRTARWSAR